jgi:hypothetical protein
MTGIKLGRTPCRVEATRRIVTQRLFSGIHFAMDERAGVSVCISLTAGERHGMIAGKHES